LRKIHAIVKHSPNLHLPVVTRAIKQEVPRTTNATAGGFDVVPAVPKVVSPCRRGDFRTGLAAGAARIIGHIENGTNQECLVTQPSRETEVLVGPNKDRLNIALCRR